MVGTEDARGCRRTLSNRCSLKGQRQIFSPEVEPAGGVLGLSHHASFQASHGSLFITCDVAQRTQREPQDGRPPLSCADATFCAAALDHRCQRTRVRCNLLHFFERAPATAVMRRTTFAGPHPSGNRRPAGSLPVKDRRQSNG